MISFWLFFLSSVIMVMSLFVEAGPAAAGWTIYPPLSALPQAQPGSGTGMTLWLVSMAIFIASSLLGSLNYIVTVINLRTKGMTMTRLPLTIWAFFVTAIIGVVSFPVLLSAALLLIMDRSFGTSFFLSDIFIQGEVLHYQGGSPVLYEHLFWVLGHPEVYIVLLPALGITSEIIATNARKPIFGYRAMVASILAIAFLSTIVWGHHMFISGMNPFLGSVFTILTLIIFTMPLFVSLLSFPVLKERAGFLGSLSVVFGFIGITIAVDPFNEPPNIFLAVALLGSFLYGLAVLSIRQLSKTEPSGTMFFYFTLSCTLGSAMFLPFGWTSPSIIDLLFLCGMGFAGGFGQFAMITAYKLAPAIFVAPIEYTQFIWAVIFGFIFWNEIPTLNIYLGGAIVIICTLLLSKTNHQST